MSQPPISRSSRFNDLLSNRPLLLAFAAVLLGLCLMFVVVVLLLRDAGIGVGESDEPTPFPEAIGQAENDVIIAGISGSTTISLALNIPTSLQLAGESFSVRPEPVEDDGTWEPEPAEGRTALWVYGTLINYVIGLPANGDHEALLEGMAPGDDITMSLREGNQYHFTVTNREYIDANRTDVFAQNVPGITLLLLQASGDERLIVQGDYVVDTSLGATDGATGGRQAELGETAQLGDLRVTVTEATSLFNDASAPPGFVYFVLDTQLQNVGVAPIDLSRLHMVLSDEFGNQYAFSPQASGRGAFPPVGGVLAPGETRQLSVGYQIPRGLTSPTLTWIVRREAGTQQVEVTIPFAGGPDEAVRSAQVTLQSAEISEDGTSIRLVGQISNLGAQPLVISQENVSLMSNGTVHLILSTNPAFPWTVPAGQTVPYTVSFQRPSGSEALFTVLNQPFQLTGLR